MNRRALCAFALAMAVVGCGGGDDDAGSGLATAGIQTPADPTAVDNTLATGAGAPGAVGGTYTAVPGGGVTAGNSGLPAAGMSGTAGGMAGDSQSVMQPMAGSAGAAPDPVAAGSMAGDVNPDADAQVADAGMGAGAAAAPGGPLEPIIPAVSGPCPEFTTGSKTVNGLSGIQFTAGPKKEGTGSIIFYWHGTGSSAAESRNIPGTARNEITEAGGVIVSFGRSSGGDDCSGTGTFSLQDFDIVDQIVACAVENHGIDPHRIYTTGCSAGGLQAGCMAIQRSNYVAATAPNSGGVTIGYGEMQDPTRVAAVMTMHGSAIDNVIVSFPGTSEAYDNYMIRAGSAMVINCDHGGGHCGAPAALQASVWEFMKDHPFGTSPSPYEGGLPAGFHASCEIATMTDVLPIGEVGPSGSNGL